MNASTRPNDLLLIGGKILTVIMQIAMGIAGIAIIVGAAALVIFGSDIAAEVTKEFSGTKGDLPLLAILGVLVIVLGVVAAMFVFFAKLRQIIDTVSEGDPFVPANADRLSLMAWLLLGVQLLMLPAAGLGLFIAKWAEDIEHANVTIDAGLDLEGILMVIVLFILARVFRHGAAMREDLEGTV